MRNLSFFATSHSIPMDAFSSYTKFIDENCTLFDRSFIGSGVFGFFEMFSVILDIFLFFLSLYENQLVLYLFGIGLVFNNVWNVMLKIFFYYVPNVDICYMFFRTLSK